MAFLN